ncbi:cyclic nucleotide-binding protein [Jatrophihabitans endophyticus]|uniref:Cyclic nucleotide-binding protein n=1 Tax=Jatrophihabitans endophyticus TaxID=1206085 RepID=A0A1M5HFG8_9ACTN|nr:cyclic nucleotide-binding domain-containing protein [Jatrophihabitans endophyticus]SHG14690.1 cyclic nucleotide-binding protein [Jatrophihabitans endophyticus]
MPGGDKRKLTSTLTGYATFADCSKDDVAALVDAGGPFTLPAGWPLVQEGIPADACFVLTEGTALVFHQREQIAELGPGDLIGEMALLGGGQRRATVTSSSRVAGLRVEYDALRTLLSQRSALADAFRAVYDAHSD